MKIWRYEDEFDAQQIFPYMEEWFSCNHCGEIYRFEVETCIICDRTALSVVDVVAVENYIDDSDWERAVELLGEARESLISYQGTHILVDKKEWASFRKQEEEASSKEEDSSEELETKAPIERPGTLGSAMRIALVAAAS